MKKLILYFLIIFFSFTSSINACYFIETETGFGVSTSVGMSTDKGETSLHPNGETSLTLKDTGHDREQITRATIGAGVIEVGGKVADDAELSGLNRDTSRAQEITKDLTTGALDATASIDNRVFTSEGRAEIAREHKELAKNLNTLLKTSKDKILSLFDSMSDSKREQIISITKKGIATKLSKAIEDDKLIIDLDGIENIPSNITEAMLYLQERQDVNFDDLSSDEQKIISAIYLTYSVSDEIKKEKVKFILSSVDKILKDDKTINNLEDYENLSISDKKETINNLSNILNAYSDDKDLAIKFTDNLPDNVYGEINYIDESSAEILYNSKYLGNLGSMINTAYHEIGGHKLTEDYISSSSNLSEDYKYIESNMFGLYVSSDTILKDSKSSLFPVYEKQPTESVAFFTGNTGEDALMSKINERKMNYGS